MFNNVQQKTAGTKYPDEVTEIFKTQGIEIQLVSGRVKIFSSCKEGAWSFGGRVSSLGGGGRKALRLGTATGPRPGGNGDGCSTLVPNHTLN